MGQMAEQRTFTGDLIEKQTRISYTQEYKLKVISFYKENKNLYVTGFDKIAHLGNEISLNYTFINCW